MKMRKIIALLMAVVMLCGVLPFVALAEGDSVTYTFADYSDLTSTAGVQTCQLDETLHIHLAQGRTGSDLLRVYANQPMTLTSTKDISSIVLKASYKDGTFYVETSDDGSTWTRALSDIAFTSAESDVKVNLDTPAKNIRIIPSAQMRLKTMTVTYVAAETPTPETPTEPSEGTITFDDAAKRTELTTEKQVWTENGVTVTNEKGASTSDVADYKAPARFYASSSLKIEFPGMTKLVVNLNSGKPASGLTNVLENMEGITFTKDGYVVTIEFAEATDALFIEKLAGQIRVNSMTAYAGTTGGEDPAPEQPSKPTTPEEIVNAAYELGEGQSLEGTYTLTGVVTKVNTPFSDQYKNVTVTIVVNGMTDKPIQCYRLKGEGADIIGEGDTITVTGTLKNYYGTVEFDAGCTLDSYKLVPKTPEEIVNAAYELGEGKALEGTFTLTGVITAVNTPYSEQYKNVTVTIVVGDMTDKPIQCFRLKGEGADLIAAGDTITVTGTLKNYYGTVEFDAGCNLDSYTKAGEEGGEDIEPPVVPEYAVVDTPVAGTAYKFGMVQGMLDGRIFYLAGGMSSYYMSTTEDVTAAIDVYLEETEGGYYLYTMDGENKLYINMVVSADGAHVNAKYEAAASTVYTYDANAKTVIAEIDGAPYWHGTRSDNTYTTVGPCKTEYNGFYCQFYAEVVEVEPENPGTGSELPETGDFALIAIGSLMVMSVAAVVLLKKKEF